MAFHTQFDTDHRLPSIKDCVKYLCMLRFSELSLLISIVGGGLKVSDDMFAGPGRYA
jgi:hypothetical protein